MSIDSEEFRTHLHVLLTEASFNESDNEVLGPFIKFVDNYVAAKVSARAADAPSEPSDETDLLEVVRTLCSIAARRQGLTAVQRPHYPHVDEEGLPCLDAARAACVKRGYTEDGLSVEGVNYPVAVDALDSRPAPSAGWVLAKQTVVEMPNDKKELGYTLLDSVGIFTSFDEVVKAIKGLSLPLGWVAMTTKQLLPGWQTPDAPASSQPTDGEVRK